MFEEAMTEVQNLRHRQGLLQIYPNRNPNYAPCSKPAKRNTQPAHGIAGRDDRLPGRQAFSSGMCHYLLWAVFCMIDFCEAFTFTPCVAFE